MHFFNSSTRKAEFQASLVYSVNSRTTKSTRRNSVSKTLKKSAYFPTFSLLRKIFSLLSYSKDIFKLLLKESARCAFLYVHFLLRNKANIYTRNGQECSAGNPVRHKHQGPDTKSCGPTPESWVQPSIGSPGEGPTDPVDQLPRGHLGEQLLSHSAVGSLYTTFVL